MTDSDPPIPADPDPTTPTSAPVPSGAGAVRPAGPGLHVVSTPIGAARDVTLRALDVLASADLLLAEDTRTLRRLLEIHGLRLGGRPLWAYHDHNGARMRPRVLAALAEGRSVALVSDAGTPLVADPGFQLVRAAIAEGHPVHAAPGASALLTALAVAGLPTDRFAFLGFVPGQAGARSRFLHEALALPMTVVLYESPHRVHRTLSECADIAEERPAALCRELTKRHEEVIRGSLGGIVATIAGQAVKGEVVLVIGGATAADAAPGVADLDGALRVALARDSLREAVDMVAARFSLPRRQVYQRALSLRDAAETEDDE